MRSNVRKCNFRRVRPTKTRISLRIRTVWSESSLSAWRTFASLANQNAPQSKILIRLRKSHADQNLRWAHISEGTFSDFEVHIKSKGNSPFNNVWIQIIICLFRIGLLNLGKINNLTNEYFETAIIMTSYIATMQSTQISCFQLFFWIWDRWRYLGLPNKLYERNETQALLT